ncbi:hypothetical protein [Flavobacterium flavigenum]|uniref:hypothetical protein n=1 Tax=Flavobacterium flavigenum TaxID=3003258 RepID=UPI0024829A6C|nr:hypothetical protein [Flavobacterium flavigenum]
MYNNTLNEDDYKEAVRSKFEKEKEGIYSNYLNNPSQANLRDLCWKIFKSNENTDDLNAYSDFFKFKFDSNNEDTSTTYTDKFKKVGRFFKGETKPAKIDTINFAAVLVDFEFRPFAKFKKHYTNGQKNTEEENDLMYEIETAQEFQIESEVKNEDSIQIEKLSEESNLLEEENLDKTALFNEEEKLIIDHGIPKEENILKEVKITQVLKPVELFLGIEGDPGQEKGDWIKRNKWVGMGILSFLGLLAYYYFTQKNECMQWSGDHYEEVSCDLEIQGIGTYNVVEPFDERIINLRKIKVCDTTTFFKNGEAVIWYAKVGDGIEFFNTHGMHPENNKKPLRPVTKYIIDKYVKEGSCKLTDKKINDL